MHVCMLGQGMVPSCNTRSAHMGPGRWVLRNLVVFKLVQIVLGKDITTNYCWISTKYGIVGLANIKGWSPILGDICVKVTL